MYVLYNLQLGIEVTIAKRKPVAYFCLGRAAFNLFIPLYVFVQIYSKHFGVKLVYLWFYFM